MLLQGLWLPSPRPAYQPPRPHLPWGDDRDRHLAHRRHEQHCPWSEDPHLLSSWAPPQWGEDCVGPAGTTKGKGRSRGQSSWASKGASCVERAGASGARATSSCLVAAPGLRAAQAPCGVPRQICKPPSWVSGAPTGSRESPHVTSVLKVLLSWEDSSTRWSSGCSLLTCTEQTPPHASPTTVWNFSGKVSYPTPTTKSQQPSSSQSSWGDKVSRWSPLTTHPHNSWMHPSAPSKCPEWLDGLSVPDSCLHTCSSWIW